jgi:hypothetical protein
MQKVTNEPSFSQIYVQCQWSHLVSSGYQQAVADLFQSLYIPLVFWNGTLTRTFYWLWLLHGLSFAVSWTLTVALRQVLSAWLWIFLILSEWLWSYFRLHLSGCESPLDSLWMVVVLRLCMNDCDHSIQTQCEWLWPSLKLSEAFILP